MSEAACTITATDKFYDAMATSLGLPKFTSVSGWDRLGRVISPSAYARGVVDGVVVYGIEATYIVKDSDAELLALQTRPQHVPASCEDDVEPLRALVRRICRERGNSAGHALLAAFGVSRVIDLPSAKYAEFTKAAERVIKSGVYPDSYYNFYGVATPEPKRPPLPGYGQRTPFDPFSDFIVHHREEVSVNAKPFAGLTLDGCEQFRAPRSI